MGSGDVSIPCGGERCPLRPPAVLCLQICALLFASLYILCHFVIRHFKKQTDFAAGRRVHPSNPPPPGCSCCSLPQSHCGSGPCGASHCGGGGAEPHLHPELF